MEISSISDLKELNYSGITNIGDVHANYDAFTKAVNEAKRRNHYCIQNGDLIDYGDRNFDILKLASDLIDSGSFCFIKGNHERKVKRFLTQYFKNDVRVKISGGFKNLVDEFMLLSDDDKEKFAKLFWKLHNASFLVKCIDSYVSIHGGFHLDILEHKNDITGAARQIAYFGSLHSTKPFLENGFPNRVHDWAFNDVPKNHIVIVGHDVLSKHTPTKVTSIHSGETYFIDTGSSKGGILTSIHFDFDDHFVKNVGYTQW